MVRHSSALPLTIVTRGCGTMILRGFDRVCRLAVTALACALVTIRSGAADIIEINRIEPISAWPLIEPPTYDSEMAVERAADGALWSAWQSYDRGQESILVRQVRDARQGRFTLITPDAGIHGRPRIAAISATDAWVTWMTCIAGRWSVSARRLQNDQAQPVILVSSPEVDAVNPTICRSGERGLLVAWQALIDRRMAIQVRRFDGENWSAIETASGPEGDAFRPVLVENTVTHETWACWDAYHELAYSVHARRLAPEAGPIERVSPPGAYAVKPEPLVTPAGELWMTWVHASDVIGGDAVVDQSNAAQVAVRRSSRWELVRGENGNADVASLDTGLLARVEPAHVPTGGYLGDRRRPFLLHDGSAVWLAWERKADETGSTPNVTGELVGMQHVDGRWSGVQRLHSGMLEYRPAGAHAMSGAWTFAASELPRESRRIYKTVTITAGSAAPARHDPPAGWKAVSLPLRKAAEPSRIIEQGRTLHLYWMDSHVHSALSADAEGEPDEILHYARDRAHLDAVVMQENDHLYDVPLTATEYALGAWLGRWITSRGPMLALPGYEWTQMLPTGGADPSRPRFWRSSFRNHRTVIFPSSGGPLLRYPETGNNITKLHEAVRAAGGIMHTQHETFALSADEPSEVAIEVTAGWGIYILNPGRIHAALNEGHRKAFVGTSDSHRRNPGLGGGLTGIYAESLTDRALLEAYRRRRVFATAGTRVQLEARVNGVLMGQPASADRSVRLELRVDSPRPVKRAVLVGDGAEKMSFPGNGRLSLRIAHEEQSATAKTSWYYWRVELEGPGTNYRGNMASAEGNLAWTTPHWVTFAP